jgi:hypothetical protein
MMADNSPAPCQQRFPLATSGFNLPLLRPLFDALPAPPLARLWQDAEEAETRTE